MGKDVLVAHEDAVHQPADHVEARPERAQLGEEVGHVHAPPGIQHPHERVRPDEERVAREATRLVEVERVPLREEPVLALEQDASLEELADGEGRLVGRVRRDVEDDAPLELARRLAGDGEVAVVRGVEGAGKEDAARRQAGRGAAPAVASSYGRVSPRPAAASRSSRAAVSARTPSAVRAAAPTPFTSVRFRAKAAFEVMHARCTRWSPRCAWSEATEAVRPMPMASLPGSFGSKAAMYDAIARSRATSGVQ
jgi:hypothetical protein